MTKQERGAMENQRDSLLIERILKGETSAFTQLFNFHKKKMFEFNYLRLGSFQDAEDALQEESVIVYDSLFNGKYEERQGFGGWFVSNARHYIKKLRRKNNTPEVLMESVPEGIMEELVEGVITDANIDKLLNAINTLPQKDILLLTMRLWENKSWKEIGEAFKISDNSASGRYSKIIKKLKKKMNKK